jgi:hypothetical protein
MLGTAWGRRGDMNRSVWIMAVLFLGTLASGCGNDCQTPVPVSCCVGGCDGDTLTPAVCEPSGLSCPAGSVAPGDCPATPPFCSGAP